MKLITNIIAGTAGVLMLANPNISGTSSPAQLLTGFQPEVASQPAINLPQGAIKLSWLKVDNTPFPRMSDSSAVRIACGATDDVYDGGQGDGGGSDVDSGGGQVVGGGSDDAYNDGQDVAQQDEVPDPEQQPQNVQAQQQAVQDEQAEEQQLEQEQEQASEQAQTNSGSADIVQNQDTPDHNDIN